MRVAIVGLGFAGSELHLPALAALSEATVVGGCDLDEARRGRVAERWSIPVFRTVAELLSTTSPEVLVVATPPEHHAQCCLDGLRAGAHIVCEKPFVSSLREADEVIGAARAAGRQVALNHEFREMPILKAILDRIGADDTGRLVFAQIWQLMDLPPWKEAGWRRALLRGTLYEAGVHLVDLAMALFNERPRAVTATMSSCGVGDGESDAVALVTLEFSGGRIAHITQNRLCPGETQYVEVRADCASASLRASFGGRARLSLGLHRSTRPHLRFEYGGSGLAWREIGHRRVALARNPRDPAAVATRRILEKTLTALHAGASPPVSAADGRDVLEVLAACYASAETGSRIALHGSDAADLTTRRMADAGRP
jgi:predicted dehydrogenase